MKPSNESDLPVAFENKAHEAIVSVWWTGEQLKKLFRKLLRSYIRSESQFNLLMVLKDTGRPMTQMELSKTLLVDRSNITGLIDGLQKQDLIRRNRVKGDRRSYHITLTAGGNRLTQKMEKIYMRKVKEITAGFSARESADLARLTNKLRMGLGT
ncbi:MAG: MarR family transcriptional regulator [Planctomycetota bacterium]|nr:MAG: MarR family transcriptional regulator [Planctomycetota bacterium]